ncbi:MAG: YjcQ family protein [Tannerellaceae bacterium]
MNNFNIMYRILKALERAMDYAEMDADALSPETLGSSKERLKSLWIMLANNGYVDGIVVKYYKNSPTPTVLVKNPRITLKGLEYLQENSMMRKCAHAAKGLIDIVS